MSTPPPNLLSRSAPEAALGVLAAFLRLGLTAFGGPIAHLGYFRRTFVERLAWLSEAEYADLVALGQFLPGPASSQVGFAIGLRRAGPLGGLAAFVGFTLPSALLMLGFAYVARPLSSTAEGAGLIHGLKLAAVAVVAQAVLGMGRTLCQGRARGLIGAGAAVTALLAPSVWGQLMAMAGGAAAGLMTLQAAVPSLSAVQPATSRRVGAVCLVLFAALLAMGPALAAAGPVGAMFDAFYRSGALVFGGGHVAVPLLSQAVTPSGWVTPEAFLQGYGAAQALPGPLFAFAAFLGAQPAMPVSGGAGAALALAALFLPGLLLMAGVLPLWTGLGGNAQVRAALAGINAAVVGVLAAALYTPIITSSIMSAADVAVATAAFALLEVTRAPPLAAVALCALGGIGLGVWG